MEHKPLGVCVSVFFSLPYYMLVQQSRTASYIVFFSYNCSQFVKGMVFKKHAAHKHMPTHCKNPKLILIEGMLGEAPISRLSSFNSMDQVLNLDVSV